MWYPHHCRMIPWELHHQHGISVQIRLKHAVQVWKVGELWNLRELRKLLEWWKLLLGPSVGWKIYKKWSVHLIDCERRELNDSLGCFSVVGCFSGSSSFITGTLLM